MDWSVRLIDLVAANHEWAPWIVLMIGVGETIVGVSVFIPSTPIMIAVGALVATGALEFLPIWAGATVGAVCGSTFSWWVGHRYGSSVLEENRRQASTTRSRAWLRRWGLVPVFVSHLFAPLASFVFLVAGAVRIPFWRFQMANLPGALVWGFLVLKAGEVGGHVAAYIWRYIVGA
jgi:membrane protein DedA with SNARE-associated domain